MLFKLMPSPGLTWVGKRTYFFYHRQITFKAFHTNHFQRQYQAKKDLAFEESNFHMNNDESQVGTALPHRLQDAGAVVELA